jgi:nickel/cobalt transporter (NiCoT) family protein
LFVTLFSILFGAFVAVVQLMSLLSGELQLEGGWWMFWEYIADRSEIIGAIMAGLFIISWFISYIIYTRFQRRHSVSEC